MLAQSQPHLFSSRVIDAWGQPAVSTTPTHMNCTKGLCDPQCEHSAPYNDPPKAVSIETLKLDTVIAQRPHYTPCPIMQFRIPIVLGHKSLTATKFRESTLSPVHKHLPWREQWCFQNQPLVLCLCNLSPRACDGQGHGGASPPANLPDSKSVVNEDLYL